MYILETTDYTKNETEYKNLNKSEVIELMRNEFPLYDDTKLNYGLSLIEKEGSLPLTAGRLTKVKA